LRADWEQILGRSSSEGGENNLLYPEPGRGEQIVEDKRYIEMDS
jgi:hypothetical protein